MRGLSPFIDFTPWSLGVFAVFYGLDWIATVPPTAKLANLSFGAVLASLVFVTGYRRPEPVVRMTEHRA